jgi:hypothetical protein
MDKENLLLLQGIATCVCRELFNDENFFFTIQIARKEN